MATESANCPGVAPNATIAWQRGLRYAHDILSDLNAFASGWVDWNLMLDPDGGPNKLGNTCDAPIIVHNEHHFDVQPMYYFIKHFSAYLPPGSKRIATTLHIEYDPDNVNESMRRDPQLRPSFPAGAYHCDYSSRQRFQKTLDHKLQVVNSSFCLDVIDEPWLGFRIEMVECQYTSREWIFEENMATPSSSSSVSSTSMNHSLRLRFQGQCLTSTRGALENGGRLTLEPCQEPLSDHQIWDWQGTKI